ncbi:MAG: glycosyltransferase [Myxococcota bacterium]
MRILMGTQVRLDGSQGGARHVIGLTSAWAQAGHQVCLLAPGHWASQPDGLEHLAPRREAPGLRMELALAGLAMRRLTLRVPEIAYVRLSASSSALPAALVTARVPLWLELNGPILDELQARGRSRRRIEAVRLALKATVATARGVVAVEPSIAEHARRELGAKSIFVVENGVQLDVATPGDRMEARRRLGLSTELRYVGFAGTLAPELRLDVILPLLERMDLRLLVAGDGPAARRLKGKPRVKWLGAVNHDQAIEVLRACDVCLGLREGWMGMRPLESVAVGRRLALWGGQGGERLRELCAELPDFVFVGRDPGGFERALQDALEAEARLGPPSEDELEPVRRRLGWEETARRLIELFRA